MSSKSRKGPKPKEIPKPVETLEIDDEYQNRDIAEKAFYLRTHLSVLNEEVQEFLAMVEKADAPKPVKSWLKRVHGNTSRYFKPAMDNLDQVRLILDKKRQGLPE